ncbi:MULTISPECIES: hypothetical protein [Catenuloplanes]|uniref:DNA-binding protein n=1 Tax=Catenuloplanes niger TaxID=587534 RepID=A0AAE4CWJ7_9ACTN|nr:hypothetical protein [Catenuloplanes niger]MDR7325603.1 hypothetical protein [Catenuloplanes niger]
MFDVISAHLNHLTWIEVDGRTVAIIHANGNPVGAASQAARQIATCLPGARVAEVDQDVVGVSDIAKRVGVTREAVRLWVDGRRGPGDFPPPIGSAGGGERGSMRLWPWSVVNDWLRQYHLHDDEESLSAAQVAEINASLHRVIGPIDREWQRATRGAHVPMRMLERSPGTSGPEIDGHISGVRAEYRDAMAWHERRSVNASDAT